MTPRGGHRPDLRPPRPSALRRGLLHGYRTTDEHPHHDPRTHPLRRSARSRPGRAAALSSCTYDDFTADILENQLLLRATVERLLRLPLRHEWCRSDPHGAARAVRDGHPGRVPARSMSRNRPGPDSTFATDPPSHLARLILDGAASTCRPAASPPPACSSTWRRCSRTSLSWRFGRSLGAAPVVPAGRGGRQAAPRRRSRQSRLEPDLSWWTDDRCVFVGDCKYKRGTADGIPERGPLPTTGLYDSAPPRRRSTRVRRRRASGGTHTVRHADKRLSITTLDLAGPPEQVLHGIATLATLVRNLACRSPHPYVAA